jgi:hypothetical protein
VKQTVEFGIDEMNTKHALRNLLITTFTISMAMYALPAAAESLNEYVTACKQQLGIEKEGIPRFSCKGTNFRKKSDETFEELRSNSKTKMNFSMTNDFVAHRQINDSVDAVFACRWVGGEGAPTPNPFNAVSGEMIVHNRHTGATCFFELQDTFDEPAYPQVPVNPISPEDSTAARVWKEPTNIRTCTECHTAGAYVASPEIVASLAKFGLINDGHDVWGGFYSAVGSTDSEVAKRLNKEIKKHVGMNGCADQCHVVKKGPAVLSGANAGKADSNAVVMPSIDFILDTIQDKGAMPPLNSTSNYRWINRDDPRFSGDYERLSDVNNEYPPLYCETPTLMQARVVDDGIVYATNKPADILNTFNLHDGLICKNADQANGLCNNYETRYRCDGKWTTWQGHDRPNASGDFERRSSYEFPQSCTDSPPDAIQARYTSGNSTIVVNGPPDRLYQFDKEGLICRNQDQPSGERCHNYMVRFICP